MSAFFVGQRVRKVRSGPKPIRRGSSLAVPVGSEGRILAFHDIPPGSVSRDGSIFSCRSDVVVNYDNFGRRASMTAILEPIVPEGQQPAEMTAEELLPFIKEKVRA